MRDKSADKPLYLNIHSIIRVSSSPMPEYVSKYTASRLSLFLTNNTIKEEESDIVISRLESHHLFEWANYHVNLEYGFLITEYDGVPAVIFSYRTKTDIVVVLTEPIRVLYSDRNKISDRLFDALMFCFNMVLCRKSGMFFHGAVAEKDGMSVLLAGPFGTKKSLLLLAMLKDSWGFISDDKFILYDGRAYTLYPDIMIRGYYLRYLPWLESIIPNVNSFRKNEVLREKAMELASGHLPNSLLPLFRKFYDPYEPVNINANVLFPDCLKMKSGRISAVVLLSEGQELKSEMISKTVIIDYLDAVQRLISYEESKISSLKERLFLREDSFRCSNIDIINSNFDNQVFCKLTLPAGCNMDDALRELKHCIRRSE